MDKKAAIAALFGAAEIKDAGNPVQGGSLREEPTHALVDEAVVVGLKAKIRGGIGIDSTA